MTFSLRWANLQQNYYPKNNNYKRLYINKRGYCVYLLLYYEAHNVLNVYKLKNDYDDAIN